jgi:hypothetical protein
MHIPGRIYGWRGTRIRTILVLEAIFPEMARNKRRETNKLLQGLRVWAEQAEFGQQKKLAKRLGVSDGNAQSLDPSLELSQSRSRPQSAEVFEYIAHHVACFLVLPPVHISLACEPLDFE